MKCRKVTIHCLLAVIFAFAIWQMTSQLIASPSTEEKAKVWPSPALGCIGSAKDVSAEANNLGSAKPKNRAKSVRAVFSHLGLGEGSVVADIGAGSGRDTWVFAKLVGETGTVFAQEIVEGKVRMLEQEARRKALAQVRAMLGCSDDPCLPPDSADLVFLHHVYHHFAKPRKMLRGIWRTLKPGGYLVVADQQRGTLRYWVPREQREKKHYWIAETTVVREAREEGFAFICCAEEHWHADKDFVLVFKRPEGSENPVGDPDSFEPLSVRKCSGMFLPLSRPYTRPVFVALGEARKLIARILQRTSGKGLEIILEEWATQKEERPPLHSRFSLPSVLTENGDPHLGSKPVDVVFFLDSYHLLFHGRTLLAKIHDRLIPTGCVYVLDRQANRPLSRREASHFRMIEPETVKREMAEAGFYLWFRGPRPARDRFVLVFGKVPPEDILIEDDPFTAGPLIPESPGRWLRRNSWRLRGLKTDSGKFVRVRGFRWKESLEKVDSASPNKQIWKMPEEKRVLYFEEKDKGYLLTNYQSWNGQ